MKRTLFAALCLVLGLAPLTAATTTKYTLSSAAWTDLGAGPMLLSFRGASSGVYAIADAPPALTREGFTVLAGDSVSLNTASHVYAMSKDSLGVDAYVAPISSAGGGGGGAATIVDGGSVTLGSKADAAALGPSSTMMSVLRQIDADIKGTDPCTSGAAKASFVLTSSAIAEPQIVVPAASTQVYICALFIMGGTPAVHVSVIGGTGGACTTGVPIAMMGSTTASAGAAFPVSGGFSFGSGVGTVLKTTTAGHGVCILQDGTTPLAFGGTYVQQ